MLFRSNELGFVDWIEVDLVEAQATGSQNRPFQVAQKVDSVSAFLRTDGVVCDTTGNPYIAFKNLPNTDYYVIIRHRNHLGVMSGVKVALLMSKPTTATPIVADFTSTIFSIAGKPNIAYYRSANVNYMYVGNTDGNDRITVSDFNRIKKFSGGSLSNYYKEDLNFDLKVTSTDINLWKGVIVGNPTEAYY